MSGTKPGPPWMAFTEVQWLEQGTGPRHTGENLQDPKAPYHGPITKATLAFQKTGLHGEGWSQALRELGTSLPTQNGLWHPLTPSSCLLLKRLWASSSEFKHLVCVSITLMIFLAHPFCFC